MMALNEENLTVHRMKITTLTPVFIGGGENANLGRTMYILDVNEHKVHILDESKWANYLIDKGLFDTYLRFISEYSSTLQSRRGQQPSRYQGGLYEWLNEKNINHSEYKHCIKYTLDAPQMDRGHDLHCFIKNHDMRPYFPGSSIKGAIRTAVLFGYIRENINSFRQEYWYTMRNIARRGDSRNIKRELQKITREIESAAFHRIQYSGHRAPTETPLNDIFKGVYVSDSTPLDPECLTVLKKLDISTVEKNRTFQKHITLFREYLKPFSTATFSITLNRNIVRDTFVENIDRIMNYLQGFTEFLVGDENGIYHQFDDLEKRYNRGFEFYYPQDHEMANDNPPNLAIGGGIGFLSKTIVHALAPSSQEATNFIRDFLGSLREFARHKHREKDRLISPRTIKLANYMGDPLIIGFCNIKEV